MPGIIFLLFVVLPFVELALLLRIGSEIGAPMTIAIVVATGIVGGYLAKQQGLSVFRKFQVKLATGRLPGDELVDGIIVLVSGALLVTPGVITDVIGFLGLLPPSRAILKSLLRKRMTLAGSGRSSAPFSSTVRFTTQAGADPEKVDITEIVDRRD